MIGGGIAFAGSEGAMLAGYLEVPVGQVRAWALFAHCFTCSKETVAASRISRRLAEVGIAVLRFDFTGLGQSEGDFSATTFSSNKYDLVAAADYLRERSSGPSILIGHSLGGAAVLAAAHLVPEVRAVVTLGAPAEPAHVTHLFNESRMLIDQLGQAEVILAGRRFRIRREFIDDIENQPQQDRIRNLGAALLVLHSPVDETVSIDNARRIYEVARNPKSFVAIDGADHLLSVRRDAAYVADMIATWATRYAGTAYAVCRYG